ncbi:MAG TPA: TRAP transporter small permease [Burkholderiales bacterium]|nr:TRAP transporter small permease [Burkholderiales bacterium]
MERASAGGMERASVAFGRFLAGLAVAGCGVLFAMMMVIVADVFFRNVRIGPLGVSWANEATEYALYLITLLTAPWLLNRGQHIRIDVLLQAVPPKLAWYSEWLCDAIALACCLAITWASLKATFSSQAIGSMVIKTLAIPEWWLLAPMAACFALLSVEIVFRMARLARAEHGPRADAVSAG